MEPKKVFCIVDKLHCFQWVVEQNPDDTYFAVIGSIEPEAAIAFASKRNIPWIPIREFSQDCTERWDWLLNLWGPLLLSPTFLEHFHHTLNIHPSYLPYGKGKDPIVWGLMEGAPIGCTMHVITKDLDAGAIWAQERLPVEPYASGESVYRAVCDSCEATFKRYWADIRAGKILPKPQPMLENDCTHFRKNTLKKQVLHANDVGSFKDFITRIRATIFERMAGRQFMKTLMANGMR